MLEWVLFQEVSELQIKGKIKVQLCQNVPRNSRLSKTFSGLISVESDQYL